MQNKKAEVDRELMDKANRLVKMTQNWTWVPTSDLPS